jgi:hypothetical protein
MKLLPHLPAQRVRLLVWLSVPFLLAGCVAAPTGRTPPVSTPPASAQSTQMAAGLAHVFVSPDHTFTLDYPAGWTRKAPPRDTGAEFDGPAGQRFIAINQGPTAQYSQSIAGYYCFRVFGAPNQEPHTVVIGGQDGLGWECNTANTVNYGEVLTVTYRHSTYVLAYASPKASFPTNRQQYFFPMRRSFAFL